MRIEAKYFDGFTEWLLRWSLEVNNGKAYLEADWFKSRTPVRARFPFDEDSFRAALPSLAGVKEEYQACWEDQDDRALIVTDGDLSITHHVYGAGVLVGDHPEIAAFLGVWRLLEDAVAAHLPAEVRG